MKLQAGKKYEIFWQDITHTNEWVSFADLYKKITKAEMLMRNVGYFIEESKKSYIFSSGIDDDGEQFFDLVVMPKGVIKKVKLFKGR